MAAWGGRHNKLDVMVTEELRLRPGRGGMLASRLPVSSPWQLSAAEALLLAASTAAEESLTMPCSAGTVF